MYDEDSTIPCPKCEQDIYDDVDQCPYCREFLSASDFRKPMPRWMTAIILLTILAFALPFVIPFFRNLFF